MLTLKKFEFNPFGESTYLIIDEASREAVVVDPGMSIADERNTFDKFVADNKLKITMVVNTHMHLDHIFGDNHVKETYGAKVAAHPDDAFLGRSLARQGEPFGVRRLPMEPVEIDIPLTDGDTVSVGNEKLHVIHVPGHSPGGIALYAPESKFVMAGDSLFCGSIGRTDLSGGSYPQLIKSIQDRLLTLPDDTTVYPGHGPSTTISQEKISNPYL